MVRGVHLGKRNVTPNGRCLMKTIGVQLVIRRARVKVRVREVADRKREERNSHIRRKRHKKIHGLRLFPHVPFEPPVANTQKE